MTRLLGMPEVVLLLELTTNPSTVFLSSSSSWSSKKVEIVETGVATVVSRTVATSVSDEVVVGLGEKSSVVWLPK